MPLPLDNVDDYLDAVRILLEDRLPPYRYTDSEIVETLNAGISELVRLRPDLYFKTMRTKSFPFYASSDLAEIVDVDYRYRTAVVNYIVGMTQLRDQEDMSDARASALLQKFIAQIMSVAA